MVEPYAMEEVTNHAGDKTPEEQLKYARLQTEGYQDDGFQDSDDDDVSAVA